MAGTSAFSAHCCSTSTSRPAAAPHLLHAKQASSFQPCRAEACEASCTRSASLPDHAEAGPTRRATLSSGLAALVAATAALHTAPAAAVQGLTAGRIPGLKGPDSQGLFTYTRPEGKSGGHGVGWTEIPRYSFKVPAGWREVPVSIADLGGTEIDLRFGNEDQGSLEIVVAPIARFLDVPEGANIKIEQIGKPDKIISGFHPEIYGKPLQEEDLLDTHTHKGEDGLTYYNWELKPHHLVAATAFGNRMFLMALSANGRQWRKSAEVLRQIQNSFQVVEA